VSRPALQSHRTALHVHNIYEKTGAKSRYELYRLVEPLDQKAT
jgi:DNA-binding CsgD family transcriptional regulator